MAFNPYLIDVRRSYCCNLHPITKIDEIFVCPFLLLRHKAISVVNCDGEPIGNIRLNRLPTP